MNRQLQDLYPALVVEHSRHPCNRRVPSGATHRASGDNPLCGDQLNVHLRLENGQIRDIGFDGVCCAVATASASLMTRAVMGGDLDNAQRLHEGFAQLMAGVDPAALPQLGELAALATIGSTQAREQCATLAWQALSSVLRDAAEDSRGNHATATVTERRPAT
jgi:nitrogen fixation NifU-like protein